MTASTPAVLLLDGTKLGIREPDPLVAAVRRCLGVDARRLPCTLRLEAAWDASRRQHNATALMSQVAHLAFERGARCIALVEVDLFVPVLTFVFGQAALRGSSGIVSTYRLANPFYGLPRDDARLRERLEKEVVHELGHMFGLVHCRHFECVMRSSTYVEEIDLKKAWLCPQCQEILRSRILPAAESGGT